MLIPPLPTRAKDPNQRDIFYRNLVRECSPSTESRRGWNRTLRTAFLTGSTLGAPTKNNKLAEHVKESAADLFAAESVRFTLKSPRRFGDRYLDRLTVAREDFADLWSAPHVNASATAGLAVEWAHVYQSSVVKLVLHRNQTKLVLIPDPADIGVLHEEQGDFDGQDAICHWFTMSLPDYERMVRATVAPVNPDRAEWLIRLGKDHAESVGNKVGDAMPAAFSVLISQATTTTIGNVQGLPDIMAPIEPMTMAPVVRMAELWVWDDRAHWDRETKTYAGDYRIVRVLLSANEEVIYETRNGILPGEHVFFPLALDPVPGIIWGNSPLEGLIPLQIWHEWLIESIKKLFDLNTDSPIAALGIMGITDEKLEKLKAPGGVLMSPMAGGDIKRLAPPLPPDIFTWLQEMDRMFASRAGRPQATRGIMDPSSRTGEQDMIRAALGSGPSLTKAMLVEAWLGKVATAMWRVRRRTYPHALRLPPSADNPEGDEFSLMDLPAECVVSVDSHSHSPVYTQQKIAKVQIAGTFGWLDADSGLEALGFDGDVRARARRMQEAQAEQAQKLVAVKTEKEQSVIQKNKAQALKAVSG